MDNVHFKETVRNRLIESAKKITDKEVGSAIKKAREIHEYNRKQIALILGIGQDTKMLRRRKENSAF